MTRFLFRRTIVSVRCASIEFNWRFNERKKFESECLVYDNFRRSLAPNLLNVLEEEEEEEDFFLAAHKRAQKKANKMRGEKKEARTGRSQVSEPLVIAFVSGITGV